MEKISEFLTAVSNNDAFAKELEKAKNKEEFTNIAINHGFDLSEQDLDTLQNMFAAYGKQQEGKSLSDEELKLVSGGIRFLPNYWDHRKMKGLL